MPGKNNIRKCSPSYPGCLLPIIFIIFLVIMPRLAGAEYIYHEILPPDWQDAEANDINNSGVVVGSGRDRDGRLRGFTYKGYLNGKGTFKEVLPFGWKEAFARSINNRGDIVGHGIRDRYKGFLYSKGDYTEISPPDWKETYAYDVNDTGVIVGYGRKSRIMQGFLYSNGTYTTLLPPGWKEAYAYGINNNSDVVGYGLNENNKLMGFLYSKGTYTSILPPGWTEAKAFDINDQGEIAGHDRENNCRGFILSRETYREISPSGFIFIEIQSINNMSSFAGSVMYKNSNMTGFIHDGRSLNTLLPSGWEWSRAHAVNNFGTVVGSGALGSQTRGFVATGIPNILVDPELVFFGGNINNNVLPPRSTTIKNIGSSKLIIGKIKGPQPPFSIIHDSCSEQILAPSAACSLEFGYTVPEEVSGITSVSIPSNDPDNHLITMTLGVYPDNDRDGYTLDAECNDYDAAVHPGATEIPGNNRDDDCNPATKDHDLEFEPQHPK